LEKNKYRSWDSQNLVEGGSKGFSANNDAFRMKKDYNTVIPTRKAMFRHLNKAIIVQFFKGVCNVVKVAMATIQRF